jgi:hypothetical protein
MKALALVLMLVALPAHAGQLTPATQLNDVCWQANFYAGFDNTHAAAIAAACGTPQARAATFAAGATAIAAARTLRQQAFSAWLTTVKTVTY